MLLEIICSPQLANSPYAQSGTRTHAARPPPRDLNPGLTFIGLA